MGREATAQCSGRQSASRAPARGTLRRSAPVPERRKGAEDVATPVI